MSDFYEQFFGYYGLPVQTAPPPPIPPCPGVSLQRPPPMIPFHSRPLSSVHLSPVTNPGRVLCLQALYFPILQHRGTHTHPMPIRLYRGSTLQSLPVSFTALSDVSAISELPRHHRDLGPRVNCADPSALGSDRRDSLGAIFR